MTRSSQVMTGLFAMALPAMAVEPLHNYKLIANHPITVSEASGVAYNWDTDTLFCIGDEGEALFQLTKTGEVIDSMAFDYNVSPRDARGLDDPEGVAYFGNNTFMLADERDFYGRVTTYRAGALRTQADLAGSSYYFTLYGGNANIGLEGVAYDPVEKAVWGIKETGPLSVFKMTGVPEIVGIPGNPVTVVQPIERRYITRWESNLGVAQASDIYALSACAAFPEGNPRRLNLLLLSRNSNLILEIDRGGAVVDTLDLSSIGRTTIEGMTMDKDGTLFLVCEGSASAPADSPIKTSALLTLAPPAPRFSIMASQFKEAAESGMIAEFTWDSVAGKSYVIEYSPDLNADTWQPASAVFAATADSTSGSSSPVAKGTQGFFRVREVTAP